MSAWRWVRYKIAISEKAAGLDAFITCDSARVQHIHTANHTVDLFCNKDPLRKGELAACAKRTGAPLPQVGQQTARAAGIVPDHRQRVATLPPAWSDNFG